MNLQHNHKNHQAPDLTVQALDSKFSQELTRLLSEGYTFIYKMSEYSSEKHPLTPYMNRQVLLEKDGERFVLGEIKEFKKISEQYGIGYTKHTLALVAYKNVSFYLSDSELKNLIESAYEVIYSYNKVKVQGEHEEVDFYYKEELPARVIIEKQVQRKRYKEWKSSGVLMVIRVKQTPYKNFRKNVEVHIKENAQYLYNQNKKMARVNKLRDGLQSFDLKRA